MGSSSLLFFFVFADWFFIITTAGSIAPSPCTKNGNNLYDLMLNSSLETSKLIMESNFIQEIEDGSLNPGRFASATLQILHCQTEIGKMLKYLAREDHNTLAQFFAMQAESYRKGCEVLMTLYKLETASCIMPKSSAKKYVSYFKSLLPQNRIYFVIGLMSPVIMWPYISQNLSIDPSSTYSFMLSNDIYDPRPEIEGILSQHCSSINKVKAMQVFTDGIEQVKNFFYTL
ncbi:uncharacterized protein LOC122791761 [Protopterus annectens]|uniref:uncharacterized protein LOC122791761 n=1 Tax=Protopterus annectens TaxID=7888 RepID=UPI001CFAB1FC|nr:uncharacterized protein LOC122791761 [Protopterus annectens]